MITLKPRQHDVCLLFIVLLLVYPMANVFSDQLPECVHDLLQHRAAVMVVGYRERLLQWPLEGSAKALRRSIRPVVAGLSIQAPSCPIV